MMTTEPTVIISGGKRVISRKLENLGIDSWTMSRPIPGDISLIFKIYYGIWLVVAYVNNRSYIYRSTNNSDFELVHTIDSKIYGIFEVSQGHALVSTAHGWWIVKKAGLSWQETEWGSITPVSPAAAIIRMTASLFKIFAYGIDGKIYARTYPGEGEWVESYTHDNLSGPWYPAIAGGPVGVLAGDGNRLLRLNGDVWQEVTVFEGIIKSIAISDQSEKPTVIISVSNSNNSDSLFISTDLGDTTKFIKGVFSAETAINAVYRTGSDVKKVNFVVLGTKAEKVVYSTFEVE